MRISKGFTTVAAAAATVSSIPAIVFGVSAAVGAAASVTSTGLQIAQHIQLQDQLKDQQELIQLQKELSKKQLAQFKKSEQLEQVEASMFSRPTQPIGPISTLQMTTRSMSRQQLAPITTQPRFSGSRISMANMNMNEQATPFPGTFHNVDLSSPRNSVSLGGSYESLKISH